MLVLLSLASMRDISPDYLNRFMFYVDTLLALDGADKKNKPMGKNRSAQNNNERGLHRSCWSLDATAYCYAATRARPVCSELIK